MKKSLVNLTTVAISVVGALALASCGSDSSGGTGTSAGATGASGAAATTAAKSAKVTFIQGVSNDPFYQTMACGAKAEAAKIGVDLNV